MAKKNKYFSQILKHKQLYKCMHFIYLIFKIVLRPITVKMKQKKSVPYNTVSQIVNIINIKKVEQKDMVIDFFFVTLQIV